MPDACDFRNDSALIQFIVQRARKSLNQGPRGTVDCIGIVEEQFAILHQTTRSFDINALFGVPSKGKLNLLE
ncbi:MAG: hypothetical protein WCL32_13775, partial [Planctomycetota bacterium]